MAGFPFKTVGFDLDGTLVETAGDLGVALNQTLALVGREPVPDEETRTLIGGGSRRMLERALERTGGPLPEEEFDALYRELLVKYEANIAVHSRPYPGCLDALDALAAKHCGLAVITNKPEYLARKLLEELGMLARFASVIGGDTLGPGRSKPAPDPILEAIARAGGGPFAMVGDSSFDIRAARAAGMPCVALSFGYSDLPVDQLGADAVIDHYDELIPALAALG